MKKLLTWSELLKLARAHYNAGGDGIVECWTESDYDEYGHITKAEALEMFSDRDEIIRDMEADADRYREDAQQAPTDADAAEDAPQPTEDDWTEDDWRPGDAPWNAPGMSPSDFI